MKIIILLALLSLTTFSCSHFHHHHSSDSSDELTLNNGKKWKSDIHTYNSIKNMQKIVTSTSPKKLEKSLNNELDKLINGCEMDGADHDALHIYLEGLMASITKLGENPSRTDIGEVGKILRKYTEYFEK